MSRRFTISLPSLLVLLSLTLSACAAAAPAPTATAPAPEPTATAVPPTATPVPPRALTVCLGQEPQSLYAYSSSSRAMWSVLEALYDGPFDTRTYGVQPVILEKIPSLKDGDALIESVAVKAGDSIVDATGKLVNLKTGTPVRPSGCTSADCQVDWDGSSELKLDRLSVTYRLLGGLKWSDGQPLTADDSVYSFELASSPDTPTSRRVVDRTAAYEKVDDLTVKWTGVPGYLPYRFETNFFTPLPRHAWGSIAAKDLLTASQAAESPLGWGPYVIQEWKKGDHITLTKNPNYFRAAEGLPKFDTLVYRFLGEPADNNLTALLTSECDVVDETSLLDEQLITVLDLQRANKLKAFIAQGPEWEHLDFGVVPASLDGGYYLGTGRADLFGDVRTRQGIAYCLDRSQVISELLVNESVLPATYLAPDNPLTRTDLEAIPYDPQKGQQLLDEAGWKDLDNDPKTPRLSVGVKNVQGGTPLTLTYLTTKAPMRVEVAKILSASLAGCGVQVDVKTLDPAELYAPGPDGPLFGRNFDLAQFSWEASVQPPCYLYQTSQIPNKSNNWLKANITGYSNPQFDSNCDFAMNARPDEADIYKQGHQQAQAIFNQELPSIPLYFKLKVAVARTDFCDLQMDSTTRSDLWNIESFDYGSACK